MPHERELLRHRRWVGEMLLQPLAPQPRVRGKTVQLRGELWRDLRTQRGTGKRDAHRRALRRRLDEAMKDLAALRELKLHVHRLQRRRLRLGLALRGRRRGLDHDGREIPAARVGAHRAQRQPTAPLTAPDVRLRVRREKRPARDCAAESLTAAPPTDAHQLRLRHRPHHAHAH